MTCKAVGNRNSLRNATLINEKKADIFLVYVNTFNKRLLVYLTHLGLLDSLCYSDAAHLPLVSARRGALEAYEGSQETREPGRQMESGADILSQKDWLKHEVRFCRTADLLNELTTVQKSRVTSDFLVILQTGLDLQFSRCSKGLKFGFWGTLVAFSPFIMCPVMHIFKGKY